MTQDAHGHARVDVKSGQERGAGLTGSVHWDVRHAGSHDAPAEDAVEVTRLDRSAVPGGEDQTVNVLGSHGELIAAAYLDIAANQDTKPWQTAELISRIQKSDTDPVSLEALHSTIFELGSEYAYRDADELRSDAHAWLRRIAEMLRKPVGLQARGPRACTQPASCASSASPGAHRPPQ
jgi:hypothetical protein